MSPSTGGQASIDGRSARRERNSDAVLDAVHELFVEGQHVPTVEEVAARAGVSLRSVYRYFPDSSQLMRAALARRTQVVEPYWHLDDLGQGTFDHRVERFVDHLLRLYDTTAATVRAAVALADSEPAIAHQIAARKGLLSRQIREQFAPELDRCPRREVEARQAQVEMLCQFGSLEMLCRERGLSPTRTREILVDALGAVLSR